MKIVFMGNPLIACSLLDSLYKSNHEIVSVVSNAPKSMGRGRALKFTPVGDAAKALGIPLISINSINDKKIIRQLEELKPDLFIIMAFRILSDTLLDIPKIGSINLHASLLPKYRGAAPIQYALMNGDEKTGITTFLIESKVDAGRIILQKEILILPEDDFGTISQKMAKNSGKLVLESIDALNKNFMPIIQNNDEVTFAPKISKSLYPIDWNQDANLIHNKVRAFSPNPCAFAKINNKRLKVFKTNVIYDDSSNKIGDLITLDKNRIAIACKRNLLELISIQVEGKKRIFVSDWIRGIHLPQNILIDQ